MLKKVSDFIDLNQGEENKKKVLENVKSNISFRGSNLWILACAIVIASVGLNMNSTAVIIGAMLISPLMGPIVGAGFGLGMYDFELLNRALKNLAIATIVGLVVSAIYFYISPFKDTQSELLSRTSPNIYDILIAFFGGLVGVVAITRVEKGNPIPGVAIATALMPPLCTAGYGLAIGNYKFFFGAMFLYTINCVFICIATFFIVKFLKYPSKKQINEKSEKQVKYAITALILTLMLPSIYFAYNLIDQKKYNQKVELFINNEFVNKGYTLLYNKITYNSNPKKIDLAFLSKKFTTNETTQLNKRLTDYKIKNTRLIIKQDTTDIKKFILNEINFGKTGINKKDLQIANLENQIKLNQYDNKSILLETRILFPEIEDVSISNHTINNNTDSIKIIPILVYRSKENLSETSKQKMTLWLEQKLGKKNIKIFKQEQIKKVEIKSKKTKR
jgi:uncharacterized hydrophobic protein (TIGR00271 family)